ncbi:RICIN domain-containing protein [Nonomuraea zeae]|uniref:Ricin B lectin domain-containing protein n=1 Tax=Nonomuraea zeae TaxID=1642303 RepID=A0A5S4G4Z1_9ACTN|nr:RICIN domain-containing protein [Nonomuraea zeae]TMR27584.1 hypothetical protein ETD85_38635 [Nonomuraea zeae]
MRFPTTTRAAGRLTRLITGGAISALTLAALPSTPAGAATNPWYDSVVEIQTFADRCFDVAGASTQDGAPIIQFGCDGKSHQRFRIRRLSNGQVAFQTFSGKCLDVQRASEADGTPIIQFRCHGRPNQRFWIEPATRGRVQIRTFSGKCLDVSNASMNDGAAIVAFPCWNNANQRFHLDNVMNWRWSS